MQIQQRKRFRLLVIQVNSIVPNHAISGNANYCTIGEKSNSNHQIGHRNGTDASFCFGVPNADGVVMGAGCQNRNTIYRELLDLMHPVVMSWNRTHTVPAACKPAFP